MKNRQRETLNRVSSRATLSASVALLGLFAGFTAGTAQANESNDASASCRQETKRVAVWPKGPKAQRVARFEDREVTVCDGKVASRQPSEAPVNAKGK